MGIVTGTDGKQYTVTYNLNPATLVLSVGGQTAVIHPASVTNITVTPVVAAPPPPPAAGLIGNFSSSPGGRITVDGVAYGVQNAGMAYSLTKVDNNTLRFQLESGENWGAAVGGPDQPGVDRTELNSTVNHPSGTTVNLSYQFMIEANAPNGQFVNTATDWFIIGQLHNDDNASGVGTSPPVAFNMLGNRLQILARYVLPGQDPSNDAGFVQVLTLYIDTNPIKTGVYHTVQLQANFSNTGGGFLKVWIDGAQVVNYTGSLGYGVGFDWEYGIYRNTSPETVAVNYRAVTIK